MDKCYKCKGEMVPGEVPVRLVVGGRDYRKMVPGLVCQNCGEGYVDIVEGEGFEEEVALELAMNGPLTGSAFRLMRKVMGYSSGEVATLFQVDPATISRWETEKQPINPHVVVLLGSMLLERANNEHTTEDRMRRLLAA
jgi:YgiT-type zinc finger domain-containing protein